MAVGTASRTTAVTLTTTANTSIISCADAYTGINTTLLPVQGSGQNAIIDGTANVTAGTAATAVNVKCIDQTGAQIGTTQPHTLAAGASANIPFTFVDQRGQIGPNTYTIQMQQVAATGNGTVNEIVVTTKTTG